MILELSLFPIEFQQKLLKNKSVQIVDNGKVIKTVEFSEPKSYAKGDFDYDLERMKYMMDTEFVEMPKGAAKDLETFEQWLSGAFK